MPNIPVPVTCPGGTLYTIHAGDSLYGLAQRFNTTVEAIIRANPGIDPNSLQLARNICIPVAPGPGPCPGGFPYIIKSGDTFYNIARNYGISVEALTAANHGIDPNLLGIGQQICVPAAAPPTQPCPGRIYTVEPGDTFYRIARKFGYTLDALLTANPGVNPDTLQTGQTLCLPPAPSISSKPAIPFIPSPNAAGSASISCWRPIPKSPIPTVSGSASRSVFRGKPYENMKKQGCPKSG
jgi:LysM repeat protein